MVMERVAAVAMSPHDSPQDPPPLTDTRHLPPLVDFIGGVGAQPEQWGVQEGSVWGLWGDTQFPLSWVLMGLVGLMLLLPVGLSFLWVVGATRVPGAVLVTL